jgi:hypothetical protein
MQDYEIFEREGLTRIKFRSENGSEFDHILSCDRDDVDEIEKYISTQIYLQDHDFFEFQYGKSQDQLTCISDDVYKNGFLFRRDYYDTELHSKILKDKLKEQYSFYSEFRIEQNYPKSFFIDRTSKKDFFLIGEDLEKNIHLYCSDLRSHKRSLFQIFNISYPHDLLRGFSLIHNTKKNERLLKIYHFDPIIIELDIFDTIPSEFIWDIQTVFNKKGEVQLQNILFYPDPLILNDVLKRWNLNDPLPVRRENINCYSYGIQVDKNRNIVSVSAQAKFYSNE